MLEKIYIEEPGHTDLNMYRCGIEDCSSGYCWGPAIRDHYIIHYILGGKGTYTIGENTYHLTKHDGFLITPETVVKYQADENDPWSYAWVGFHGLKASTYLQQAGLSIQNPVFRYERDDFLKDCLFRMIEAKNLKRGKEIRLLGLLYEFISQLVESADSKMIQKDNGKAEYVKKAVEFIHMNYSRKISIAEIAHAIGLDRSYLYSLFNEYVNISPKEYLIDFRMEKACELMQTTDLSIGNIARSVGYEDPLVFSKVFRKVKGVCPRDYRSSM